MMAPRRLLTSTSIAIALALGCPAAASAQPPRLEFTRMVAHWAEYADPDYLKFIEEAKPEVAQVGFYGGAFLEPGPHAHSATAIPPTSPSAGLAECGQWFEDLNAELHRRGVKVVGHFNVEFLVGDPDGPDGPRGFFKFYRDLWDEKELGPKPVADPLELLARNADGTPIVHDTYSIGGMREYWACLNNPHWQAVLKAWVKLGIRRGVDGFITNYFYRHNCLCEHCVAGFSDYLAERFTPDQLREQFGIADLATARVPRDRRLARPEGIDAAAPGDAALLADRRASRPSTRSSSSTAARSSPT